MKAQPSAAKAKAPAKKKRAGRNPGSGRRKGRPGGVRIDSLSPALGDDEKRRQVCQWIFAEGLSQAACVAKIQEQFGFRTTRRAVGYFQNLYKFQIRVERAKEQAAAEKGSLPADWDARIREALAQRRFVAAFQDLDERQLAVFEKIELDKRKVDLQASALYLSERRLQLQEKKAEAAATESPRALTTGAEEEDEQRIQRILGGK